MGGGGGGGCKVFTVLCSLGKLADSTLSVYSVYMYFKVMMKRGVVFSSDHLENSLITSQNVMDLSIGILFFQESTGILHPPSCMDRPWI